MKILIAYDGSECANRAIDDLRRAGLPPKAEATVITAADVLLPVPPPSSYEVVESAISENVPAAVIDARARARHAVDEAHKLALSACERIKGIFPAWKVQADAIGDSPAWAVIKRAKEWEADLVVIGSHGRTAVGRFFLGSVSQKVVTRAACSVRIARGRAVEDSRPVRIVIGVDGSAGAEAAVRAVCERSWPPCSEARLVAALDPMMITAVEWIKVSDRDEHDWVRRMVDASAEKLRAAELIVSSLVKEGDPRRVLVDEAEQWEADSLFVGARGLRLIERFLIGSVSAAIAVRAGCSVEVVRPR
jgi:nucleotide-binding universal stress UspA family protein